MHYSPRLGGTALGLLLFAAGAVGTWLTYRIFVTTTTGQRLDNTALRGSAIGRGRLWEWVEPVLAIVSVPFVIAVLGATAFIALARRRPLLALQAIILVGGANLTTQVLKYVVWTRPELTEPVGSVANSLPSGHTTVAATAAAALLLVVPRAARPPVAVLAAGYAALTGLSTMVGGWHRPSDVIAAVTVVLGWAGLTTIVTAMATPEPSTGRDRSLRSTAVVTAALFAGSAATGTLALSALIRVENALAGDPTPTGRQELATAYAGGALGVIAIVSFTYAAMLVAHQVASRAIAADRSSPPIAPEGRGR